MHYETGGAKAQKYWFLWNVALKSTQHKCYIRSNQINNRLKDYNVKGIVHTDKPTYYSNLTLQFCFGSVSQLSSIEQTRHSQMEERQKIATGWWIDDSPWTKVTAETWNKEFNWWFNFGFLYLPYLRAHSFPLQWEIIWTFGVWFSLQKVIIWLNCWFVYDLCDRLTAHVFLPHRLLQCRFPDITLFFLNSTVLCLEVCGYVWW